MKGSVGPAPGMSSRTIEGSAAAALPVAVAVGTSAGTMARFQAKHDVPVSIRRAGILVDPAQAELLESVGLIEQERVSHGSQRPTVVRLLPPLRTD